ncbi:hypothetical protein [Solimonas variicoloris]|uniref:hypothetical protein n=1 Tax=Solimonas variicoloris TaxID=254408 RepID=UPI0012B65399|nr:hypothetical protein [Solimonas variicoloris]
MSEVDDVKKVLRRIQHRADTLLHELNTGAKRRSDLVITKEPQKFVTEAQNLDRALQGLPVSHVV